MLQVLIAICALLAASTGDQKVEEIRRLMLEGRYADAEREARALLSAEESAHGADSLQVAEVLDQFRWRRI